VQSLFAKIDLHALGSEGRRQRVRGASSGRILVFFGGTTNISEAATSWPPTNH
jgi:hypothetical protein